MPEDKDQIDPKDDHSGESSELEKIGKDELIDIIRSTRSEAKKYRLELKKLKDEIIQFNSEKEKKEQQKKIEEGKKDEVIAELQKQIDSLKPEADEFKNYKSAKKELLKQKAGDKWLDSMGGLPIADLEILVEKLAAPNAVGVVSGNGKPPGGINLTDEEKSQAKAMGLSEESFVRFKETSEKLKRK